MLEDGRRPCLYLVPLREPALRSEESAAERPLFARQNVDWRNKTLDAPCAPPPRRQRRRRPNC